MRDESSNLPFWLAMLSLSRQATRDALTGLYNRRYFDETLADHLAAAHRYGRSLSLVLLDLDNFKQINDTLGHPAGDDALRRFSELLSSTARRADIVCRYGGDEFAVILPETGKDDARSFVQRLQQALQKSGSSLTVQCGIAALPLEQVTCEEFIRCADRELRVNKQTHKPA